MSRARAKGTRAETDTVNYIQSYGLPAARQPLAGAHDRGDIHLPDWCLEVKAAVTTSYGAWLREAERERDNSGKTYAAVVHKPRGIAQPAGYHVVLTLAEFTRLLKHVEELEAPQ